MALDWHRPAGKSIRDGTLRSLARKGLDILDIAGVSIVGDYNHSSRHLIDGVVHNHVEEALGSAKYEEICKQHTILNNIHYCQSGVSFVDGFRNPRKIIPVPGSSDLDDTIARPAVINHDYLVLEVEYGYDGKVFIRAEKTGQPPEKAGILLTVDSMYEETESAVRLFTIRCFGREVGRLPEILAILADHSPEYSLRDQNCWQYTRWTARRLMQRCQQQRQGQGQLSDDELRLLQIEEDSIERRIASTHLKRIVRKGKKGLKSMWNAWGSAGQGNVPMELSCTRASWYLKDPAELYPFYPVAICGSRNASRCSKSRKKYAALGRRPQLAGRIGLRSSCHSMLVPTKRIQILSIILLVAFLMQ